VRVFPCRRSWGQSSVEWTAHGAAAALKYVGVNHRRLDIFVAQQFLYRSDVVTGLEQVSGERVTKGMWTDRFANPGDLGCFVDCLLKNTLVKVMAFNVTRERVLGALRRGKDILPVP
jgi:hypothetical protein